MNTRFLTIPTTTVAALLLATATFSVIGSSAHAERGGAGCGSCGGDPDPDPDPRTPDICSWTLNGDGTSIMRYGQNSQARLPVNFVSQGAFSSNDSVTINGNGASTVSACMRQVNIPMDKAICAQYGADGQTAYLTHLFGTTEFDMPYVCPTTTTPDTPVVSQPPRVPNTPAPTPDIPNDDLSVIVGENCSQEHGELSRSQAQRRTPNGFRVDRTLRNEHSFENYETPSIVIDCRSSIAVTIDEDRNVTDECLIDYEGWTEEHSQWALGQGECPTLLPTIPETTECEQTAEPVAITRDDEIASLTARLEALESTTNAFCSVSLPSLYTTTPEGQQPSAQGIIQTPQAPRP